MKAFGQNAKLFDNSLKRWDATFLDEKYIICLKNTLCPSQIDCLFFFLTATLVHVVIPFLNYVQLTHFSRSLRGQFQSCFFQKVLLD